MNRNTLATRLATLATVALSVAGFTALDTGAQGKVRLNGGTSMECAYSSITVAPNGDLTVQCQSTGGGTQTPVCTVSAPSQAYVGNITVSASCSPAASSYVWTASLGTAPSGQSSTIAVGAGTYQYTVTGSNSSGAGPASAPASVTVSNAPVATDVPRNCAISTSPATPVAGVAATLTMSCDNSPTAFAWYPYEGATIAGLQNQTTTASQSVTFPSAGTYKMWLAAGNAVGTGDTFSGSVTVGSSGDGGTSGCPAVTGVVGPTLGYETLGNLRFDLRPGSIGSALVSMPLNGLSESAQVTAVGATKLETPSNTIAEVAISKCPGTFDVPAACKIQVYGTTGLNFLIGPLAACVVNSGNYYVNIKHLTCTPATGSGINYCSHYVKFNGR